MPIYEYQCPKCGKVIEKFQGVNDSPPKCHGKMKRLISKGSFILTGKGWYATDYKNKKEPEKKGAK